MAQSGDGVIGDLVNKVSQSTGLSPTVVEVGGAVLLALLALVVVKSGGGGK